MRKFMYVDEMGEVKFADERDAERDQQVEDGTCARYQFDTNGTELTINVDNGETHTFFQN